jgi:hypothetical protein
VVSELHGDQIRESELLRAISALAEAPASS